MIALIIVSLVVLFAVWLMGGGEIILLLLQVALMLFGLWCTAIIIIAAHKVVFVL